MTLRRQRELLVGASLILGLAAALAVGPGAQAGGRHHADTPTAADCEALARDHGSHKGRHKSKSHRKHRDTTILTATWIPALAPNPAHCLVLGFVQTGNRWVGFNEVNFKAWLPVPWNGKYHMAGGGGFVSPVDDRNPTNALSRGYAEIYTDTGHQAGGLDASWAQDNPTKVIDFGYRGVHVTAKAGKDLVRTFYGKKPKYSYFTGCSRGGGQAMMESQRFPGDFDGIVAGAPAYNWTAFMTGFAHNEQHMYPDAGDLSSPALPLTKLALLEQQVDARCDALDTIADGIVDDPRQCLFMPDLDIPLCAAGDEANPACMTQQEIDVVKAVYAGPANSTGQIWSGFPLGNEGNPSGWANWIVGSQDLFGPGIPNLHYGFADSFFRYMAFPDNDDGTSGLQEFDAEDYDSLAFIGRILNATSTNLKRFSRTGKIIYWNGWADAAINANGAIEYFEALQHRMGKRRTKKFARLYLAPGVQHCGGGEGPNQFDLLTALEDWVEHRSAPEEIIATHPATGMTRPLCPYPQVARQIDPAGSTTDASNFRCVEL